MRGINIIVALLLASGCLQETDPKDAKTFQDCQAAGYPILETYPRQCRTPDNRTFTSDQDVFQTTRDNTCGDDSECALVNTKNGLSCCWIGNCEQPDYSLGHWQAVDKDWYQRQRTQTCPKEADCGPAPMCEANAPIGDYKAACVNSKCIKLMIT
ncbi:MAG: hypothetical protein V1875_03625 [Candidatus Altiarchaeota archaeon]